MPFWLLMAVMEMGSNLEKVGVTFLNSSFVSFDW